VTNQEYIDVKNHFESTTPGMEILKIERIQNPRLYVMYTAHKKTMDKDDSPNKINEQKLFHGCAKDAAQKIIHQGFNRSYAGLHRKNVH